MQTKDIPSLAYLSSSIPHPGCKLAGVMKSESFFSNALSPTTKVSAQSTLYYHSAVDCTSCTMEGVMWGIDSTSREVRFVAWKKMLGNVSCVFPTLCNWSLLHHSAISIARKNAIADLGKRERPIYKTGSINYK